MRTRHSGTPTTSLHGLAVGRLTAATMTELHMLSSWLWPLRRGLEWLLRVGARPSARTILQVRAAEDETPLAAGLGGQFRFGADEPAD